MTDTESDTEAEDTTGGDTSASTDADGEDGPTKVAIACQGGGSHTAFTAGVLRELLSEWDHNRHELVGISGTSGGAFNAVAAWYGLVTGDERTAVDLVDSLWADIATDGAVDRITNDLAVWGRRIENSGFPTPDVSPYVLPSAHWSQQEIKRVLERHIDFDALPELCAREVPELVVGTVDVQGGVFETFVNEEVTPEAVLASAAVPDIFPGIELHGHLHWDGLFSQNPPITDLLVVDADRKPDEVWVVQVNPQQRAETPRTPVDIADRRNELSGNISLNQEIRFVRWVNEWIEQGLLPEEQFSSVTVRRLELDGQLGHASKLDRRREFIEDLIAQGEACAAGFRERLDESPDAYELRYRHGADEVLVGHEGD